MSDSQRMISISKLTVSEDIPIIESLAKEIWTEFFTPIIGEVQVRYMLNKFQSYDAIQKQLNNGVHYYVALLNQEAIGYIAFEKEEDSVFVSKLYVKNEHRYKGIGKQLFSFAKTFARFGRKKTIYLTVNKNNQLAITAYKAMGFKNVAESVKDIGDGFVMDDYRMGLELQEDK